MSSSFYNRLTLVLTCFLRPVLPELSQCIAGREPAHRGALSKFVDFVVTGATVTEHLRLPTATYRGCRTKEMNPWGAAGNEPSSAKSQDPPFSTEKEQKMTKRRRRNHTSVFKPRVAMEALRGERTLAASVGQYDVRPKLAPGLQEPTD